jgi:hypothetical protein
MGAILLGYYEEVGRELGLDARTRLAMLTKISSTVARDAEDSLANVRLFEQVLARLKRESTR